MNRMKPKLYTAFSFLIILISGCGNDADKLPLYGAPTIIKKDRTPLQAMCEIREEFRALPKPLMQKKTYTSRWTSYKFGAAPVEYQGFYRIHLSEPALEFLKRHSRLEVVASLLPLFIDKEVGGEAAVLLAGIPAGPDAVQGGRTRSLANLINESLYLSPSSPGRWFEKAHEYQRSAISLYGLTNTTESIHRSKPSHFTSTLEYQIVKVLKDVSRLPLRPYAEGPPRMPQPHSEELVREWVANHSAPELNIKAVPIIQSLQTPFSALAAFPLLPFPSSLIEGREIYFMWMLGMQDEHWPALLSVTTGLELLKQRRKDFRDDYRDYVLNACDTEKK
jgi:hypothetical protein